MSRVSLLEQATADTSKIFLEYWPKGDLSSLLNHHWALNMTNQHQKNQQPDRYIPEPAIAGAGIRG